MEVDSGNRIGFESDLYGMGVALGSRTLAECSLWRCPDSDFIPQIDDDEDV